MTPVRGEVWLFDLGMAEKVRAALVISVASKTRTAHWPPLDPTLPITSFKTAWIKVRQKAGVKGRWRDNRHTLVTELAEGGAGDEEHCWARIAGHALALLPCTDGSEAAGPRRDRHAPTRD